MSEVVKQVKVFEVNYSCSKCEDSSSSFMLPTGLTWTSNPPSMNTDVRSVIIEQCCGFYIPT